MPGAALTLQSRNGPGEAVGELDGIVAALRSRRADFRAGVVVALREIAYRARLHGYSSAGERRFGRDVAIRLGRSPDRDTSRSFERYLRFLVAHGAVKRSRPDRRDRNRLVALIDAGELEAALAPLRSRRRKVSGRDLSARSMEKSSVVQTEPSELRSVVSVRSPNNTAPRRGAARAPRGVGVQNAAYGDPREHGDDARQVAWLVSRGVPHERAVADVAAVRDRERRVVAAMLAVPSRGGRTFSPAQVPVLIAAFGVGECEQQVEWLAYRPAEDPAAMLAWAIRNRAPEPARLAWRRSRDAELRARAAADETVREAEAAAARSRAAVELARREAQAAADAAARDREAQETAAIAALDVAELAAKRELAERRVRERTPAPLLPALRGPLLAAQVDAELRAIVRGEGPAASAISGCRTPS